MVSVFCSLVNEINFLTLCPGTLEGEERVGGEWDDQLHVSNYKRDDLLKLTRIHISLYKSSYRVWEEALNIWHAQIVNL
jgi:hypothetical protein